MVSSIFPGADPERPIVFSFPARAAACRRRRAQADPKRWSRIEVKLVACRSRSTARLVNPQAARRCRDGQVYALIVLGGEPRRRNESERQCFATHTFTRISWARRPCSRTAKMTSPGRQGEFVIDSPHAWRALSTSMAGSGGLEAMVPVPPLEPGEDRDCGDVTLKERP